ncbi:hypothetical protein [Halochromatium roseum]|uniref:hypothetical protein n=1 Tax=Halochromatium roseum TaxID=391920 RepID=UPI0019124BE4|nr:hypothetical protein [Halochromatium roseum]MBK5942110.1 hypothetical protein [Halochromatium roseum]
MVDIGTNPIDGTPYASLLKQGVIRLTVRLDDVAEITRIDWLKVDILFALYQSKVQSVNAQKWL